MLVTETCHRHVPLVAVIDGNDQNRGQVADALISFYRVVQYSDADRALSGMRREIPDIALIDDQIPGGGGYNLTKAMRRERGLENIPVILTAHHDEGQSIALTKGLGSCILLLKPYRRSKLIVTISSLLNKFIEENWSKLPSRPRAALNETISVFNSISDAIDSGDGINFQVVNEACTPLVEAIENNEFKSILGGVKDHDNYTFAHSLKIATLLSLFGKAIGLSYNDQLLLAGGGLLHDVGKMTIPHDILNKPGRLHADEFEIMKGHVPATLAMLEINNSIPKGAIIIAAQHHEKLDGTGYPKGLKGKELNELARMSSIVDVFGALTDRRVYKPSMPAERAFEIMTEQMPDHLDQNLLKMFKGMMLDAIRDV